MQSDMTFGSCAALFGEITFKEARVEQANVHDYPVLRMSESPGMQVHLVRSNEAAGEISEPGCSCVMTALTNAVV